MSQVLVIAWFKTDQWVRVRAVSTDGNRLEKTYEGWIAYAEGQVADLRSTGSDVRKVDVHLDELVTRCKSKEIPIDGHARSRLAADKLQLESKGN